METASVLLHSRTIPFGFNLKDNQIVSCSHFDRASHPSKTIKFQSCAIITSETRTQFLPPLKCSFSNNARSDSQNPLLKPFKNLSFGSLKTSLSELKPINIVKWAVHTEVISRLVLKKEGKPLSHRYIPKRGFGLWLGPANVGIGVMPMFDWAFPYLRKSTGDRWRTIAIGPLLASYLCQISVRDSQGLVLKKCSAGGLSDLLISVAICPDGGGRHPGLVKYLRILA